MTSDPPDLRSLRRTIPDHVADAVHIALEKVPADRFARAADFVGALAGSAPAPRPRRAPGATASQRPAATSPWARLAPYGLALVLLAVAAAGWLRPARPGPVSRQRVALWQTPLSSIQSPGANSLAAQAAIAPDGASIVFADSVGEHRGLWIKHRHATDPIPMAGTEGGVAPFFSPDGGWIGYFTPDGTLKKVPVTGGGSIALVSSDVIGLNFAATWLDDGTIVFAGSGLSLFQVPGDGGTPTRLAADSASGIFITAMSPLPDSRGVLYTGCRGNCVMGSFVGIFDIAGGSARELVAEAAGAWYAPTGHLLYADRAAVLLAATFDLGKLELTSGAMPILEGIAPRRFAVSRSGTLVHWLYQQDGGAELVWVDRAGVAEPLDSTWRGEFEYPAVSPDGGSVAVSLRERTTQLWIRRSDGTREQLTQQGVVNWRPSWSPDGRSVAFSSGTATDSGGDIVIRRMPVDGSAPPELLQRHTFRLWEAELSRDGRWLLTRSDESGVMAIRARRLDTDTILRPLLVGGLYLQPALSPDGRWLAHVATIDGQSDIFVTPFPGGGPSRRVSRDGGGEPRWARNGRELFFKSNGMLMSVAVTSGAALSLGTPRPLFSTAPYRGARNHPQYDVAPDGRRFLMIREPPVDPRGSTIYVENWFTELEARLASRPAR
jgi:eukaryotic-like serine/threonine-protein kinase